MATATPEPVAESRMHRLRVGDVVSYSDISEWPPIHREGPITSFENEECTYVSVSFTTPDALEMVLTEDEVKRVG
jgi:hypothetical protein